MVERRTRRRTGIVAAVLWAAVAGCGGDGASGSDAGDTETGDPIPLTAVDLLVVIDDTAGSGQEEPILAAGLYDFISALLEPPPSSTYAAVDDIRVAAITTNMGFSADGESMDDAWPGDVTAECHDFGDNGHFQDIKATSVEFPDGGVIDCPALANQWAESTGDAPNADLAAQAACLAMQGITGCGWMQPLQSVATALAREDQLAFVRDDALLAIVVSSNEDDCSMQDGAAMFAEDEIADQSLQQFNIACGNHPEHLLDPTHFFERFNGLKANAGAVVFVGIVGVPYGDQPGAPFCQGFGDELGDCNAQEEMQLVPEQPEGTAWYFRPSCVRVEGDVQVTNAEAPRRFVTLANESFGADSYIYSHCNADWTPAFDALAAMIAGKLEP